MTTAGESEEPTLLSLPEDLFDDIGSGLNDKDLCNFELTGRIIYNLVSRPRRHGPCKRQLNLHSISPHELRWVQQRIRRYRHIVSPLWDCVLEGEDSPIDGYCGLTTFPLPSLLADCAPSTELSLSIKQHQGERFLTMCDAHIVPSVEIKLSTFWTAVKQLLTGLTINMNAETFKPQHLGALAMFPALQRLRVECFRSKRLDYYHGHRLPYLDLSRGRLALKLPDLVSLQLYGFEEGEVVLQCPKLTKATFDETESLHIELEDANLTSLKLLKCNGVQLTAGSLEKQLQNLETLIVRDCSEIGGRLIGYVDQLQHLQLLEYTSFPAACMPQSFPKSLLCIWLRPTNWSCDLPEGLVELHGLEDLVFRSDCKNWDITRPLAELLPMDSLQSLTLGYRKYIDEGVKPEWVDRHTPGLMRYRYYRK